VRRTWLKIGRLVWRMVNIQMKDNERPGLEAVWINMMCYIKKHLGDKFSRLDDSSDMK
jgi:hypothetical protein